MKKIMTFAVSLGLLTFAASSFAADSSVCEECHDDGEFSGLSAADIVEDLQDPGIPPHSRFAELSEEDLQAIAAELAGN